MKIENRWLIVLGAVMIQLALGAIYAWSVFTKMLTDADGDFLSYSVDVSSRHRQIRKLLKLPG